MNATVLKISFLRFISGISVIVTALLCIPSNASAENNDKEVFNQLYDEIISSSAVENPSKNDSMGSSGTSKSSDPKMAMPAKVVDDQVNEQLKNEIEKIVKDAQLRHSDAVKFMKDEK